MDVELSSTNTTLGSWPDWEAKKVTSPLSSALTLVGCTRLLTALLARQSPGAHAAAVAGRGASRVASSIRTPIKSAGRRSWRSLMGFSSQSVTEAELELEVAGDRIAAGDHHLVRLSAKRGRSDGVAQVAVARLRPADLRSRDSPDGLDDRKGGVDACSLAERAGILGRLPFADVGQPQGRDRDQGEHPDDDQGGEQGTATVGAHHPPPTLVEPGKTGGRMLARLSRFCGCSESVCTARRKVSRTRAGRLSKAGSSSPLPSGEARMARATTTMFTFRMFAGWPV